jgi:DHA2 family multidrug resistance protein
VLQGAALAFFFIPLTTLTLSGITPDRIAAAAGLSNFVRITAGAMGTSISTTLWENRATLHHTHLVEHIGLGDPVAGQTLNTLQGAGMSYDQALSYLNRLVDQQAFTRAADDIFLASAVLFIGLIAFVWLTKRPPKMAGPVDAGGAH